MENNHLSRRVDNSKSEVSDVIDDLVKEVEKLEEAKSALENTVEKLESRIEELEGVILDLEEQNNSY